MCAATFTFASICYSKIIDCIALTFWGGINLVRYYATITSQIACNTCTITRKTVYLSAIYLLAMACIICSITCYTRTVLFSWITIIHTILNIITLSTNHKRPGTWCVVSIKTLCVSINTYLDRSIIATFTYSFGCICYKASCCVTWTVSPIDCTSAATLLATNCVITSSIIAHKFASGLTTS